KLVVLNTNTGDVASEIDISSDIDDVFYDAKRHRIYAICGAGNINVIDQARPDSYSLLTRVPTVPGSRTGLFFSERDTLFVAVPHRGSQHAEIRVYKAE